MIVRVLLFVSLFLSSSLLGNERPESRESTDHADDLFEILQEASDIATRYRLNTDEIPEFTTVLRAEELEAAGVKDLFDALALVPGIQTSMMQNGIKKVVMRGYDNPNNFVFDKFKLIIDGHTISTVDFQNTSYYLNFPIELIDRIEVTLGPAAALKSSGALTGIIEVRTKTASQSKEGALFVRGGGYGEVMGGTRQAYRLRDDARLSLDGYYRKHDRKLDADDYELGDTLSREPESSEWLKDYSVGASFRDGGFELSARLKRERHGNYFGWEEYLEQSTDPGMASRYIYIQGKYGRDVSEAESISLKLDYSHFKYDADAQNYFRAAPGLYLPFTHRLLQSEADWQMEASLLSTRFENHLIRVGWHGIASRQYSNDLRVKLPDGSVIDTTLTKEGLKRYLSSFYLTDAVTLTDRLDAHFALRYDHLSDMHKGYYSIDATLLYRPMEGLTVKAGYGHAYRAPSWIELYTIDLEGLRAGNPNLEAEEADTFEGSLIYAPTLEHLLKLNLYYTNIDNLIDNREILKARVSHEPEYANYDNRESKGFEASYLFKPSPTHSLTLACAYNDTEYVTERNYHQSMPGVAHWNGYLLYFYNLDASTTLSTRIQYMGPRIAYHDFGRENLSSYTTVDLAYSYIDSGGWRCYAAVKNLFDDDVRDSSYYDRHDGIVRPGRTFFFTIEFPL